jgi:protein-tyrosine phosphatase
VDNGHEEERNQRSRAKHWPCLPPSYLDSVVVRLLFVCSGNICRSPLAEAIFKAEAKAAGLSTRFEVDSAGTHGYHEGEPADPRTRRVGRKNSLDVDSVARPVRDEDFDAFDLIVAMDRGHLRELRSRAGAGRRAEIRLMLDFDPKAKSRDVADPYYGGESGFDAMYATLVPACRGLLDHLKPE